MKKIREFRVVPYLPVKIKPLLKIAYNLWWVWDYEAIDLFRRLDVDLWRETEHNPVKFLGLIPQVVLDHAAESESFIDILVRAKAGHGSLKVEERDYSIVEIEKKVKFQPQSIPRRRKVRKGRVGGLESLTQRH